MYRSESFFSSSRVSLVMGMAVVDKGEERARRTNDQLRVSRIEEVNLKRSSVNSTLHDLPLPFPPNIILRARHGGGDPEKNLRRLH